MADIISGKQRFNGNRKAPIKMISSESVEDMEVAASSEWDELEREEYKEKIRKHRIRVGLSIAGAIALLVALVIIINIMIDNYEYSSYVIEKSQNREDIESTKYITYGDGYLRYSNDGIAYYHKDGKAIWDETFSMQKPQIKISGDSVVVGDITGSGIYVFNKKGLQGKVDTSMVIEQVEVSRHGTVVAVLQDSYANYINMYDKNGEKIYSVKTTLSGDGYPLDISVSEDSEKLVASYVQVSGEEIRNNVVFYNFSEVGKNQTERVVGGFSYNDIIVGDVEFINKDTVVAVGENVISIYKIKEYPTLEKTININNEIQRVFFSNQYIGLVVDNSESGNMYKMLVYNVAGNKILEKTFDKEYDDIQFDGKSIVMNDSNSLVLMNLRGKKIATIGIEMPVSKILTLGKRGSYILINSKYIQTIKLK